MAVIVNVYEVKYYLPGQPYFQSMEKTKGRAFALARHLLASGYAVEIKRVEKVVA